MAAVKPCLPYFVTVWGEAVSDCQKSDTDAGSVALYKDVKFFFILQEEEKEFFAWARWLQHTANEKYSMIEANNEVAVLNYLCGANESLLEEQISTGDNLFKQYVLWTAVNELYHCHGYAYIEISELNDSEGKDEDFYNFGFEIMDSETGQNALGGYKGSVKLYRLVGENYVAGKNQAGRAGDRKDDVQPGRMDENRT